MINYITVMYQDIVLCEVWRDYYYYHHHPYVNVYLPYDG